MSTPRVTLAAAALFALLVLLLAPGGPARPSSVSAANCAPDKTGTLVIEISDQATGGLLGFSGSEVLVNPDPRDFNLDHTIVDLDISDATATEDDNSATGVISVDACSTQGAESYTASVFSMPEPYDDCDIVVASDTGQLASGAVLKLELEVDCTGIGPTPTVGPTATPSATTAPAGAAQVLVNASPLEVSCNGTSVITVTIRDASENPVGAGAAVTLTASFGTVSPGGSQVTNADGKVIAFFTGPANSGGIATITAVSGSLKSSAAVNVKCGGTAAISTVSPSGGGTGIIRPPNTGDAGFAGDASGPAPIALFIAGASVAVVAIWLLAFSRRPSSRR